MAALDTTSLSDEPAFSGWWVVACLSAAALVLLFAALIQQASKLSDTLISLTGGQAVQTAAFTELAVSEESVAAADTENSDGVNVLNSLTQELPIQSASAQSSIDDGGEDVSAPSALAQNNNEDTLSPEFTEVGLAPNSDDVALATSINEEPLASEERPDTQDSLISDAEISDTEELPAELTAADTDLEQASNADSQLAADSIAPQTAAPNTETGTETSTELVEEPAAAPYITGLAVVAPVLVGITPIEPIGPSESIASEQLGGSEELSSTSDLSLATLRRDVLTNMTRRSKLIRFETGTAELTPASSPLLEQTFEDLFLYAESNIVIEVGSLDGADELTNQSLSNERAQTIRAFLIERGIDGERLVISLLPDAGESAGQQYINVQANL